MGIPVDHLGGKLEGGCVSPVTVDDDQFRNAIACRIHTDIINQTLERIIQDTDRTGEIIMVVRYTIRDER